MDSNQNTSYCLKVENVSFTWPSGEKAVDECSFVIPGPGLWMIVGSNGSGKSTLFRLICGMFKVDKGKIHLTSKPSLVFQNPDHQLLLPSCNSDLLLSCPRDLTQDQCIFRIEKALEEVGMKGMGSRPIHSLSGGQKQRLALAGCLVSNSSLLLLDEPTALLDPISQKKILKIVKELTIKNNHPITALWITHRLEELKYANGAARMEKGKVGNWQSGDFLMNQLTPLASRQV
tara:strand:+ start:2913 stop:3608 length:696 start_codon:yes stop_codon:yes gene_type:complete